MTEGARAVIAWLEHQADPRDEVTLLTTSGDAWWSDSVERGREDLVAVLRRVRGRKNPTDAVRGMSEWEAYRIDAFENANGGSDAPDAQGALALAGRAAQRGMHQAERLEPGRSGRTRGRSVDGRSGV